MAADTAPPIPEPLSQENHMHPALPTIYCPNPKCRAANKGGGRFCQTCGGTVPQRYLWVAVGETQNYQVGDLLLDRYLFCSARVVLDTQPGLPLGNVFELDQGIIPYLKLFPFRTHIPQIYSLSLLDSASSAILVLLEGVPLIAEDFSDAESLAFARNVGAVAGEKLIQVWRETPLLRQLNWLWQIAGLWSPLFREKVASSLLNPDRLRVEGSLVRLLELSQDDELKPVTLADLGAFWKQHCPLEGQWQQPFLEVCDRLIEEQIISAEALTQTLEDWLFEEQQSYRVQIDIATRTDTGPLREHNEDACYPTQNTVAEDTADTLTIVCDGVGGHASGEVASATAIAALTDRLHPLIHKNLAADDLQFELERAVDSANDLITQQNDAEQRQDRDRMGTTVVMALHKDQHLYITNVGDSRAYLITPQGCYQATVDDDIASREVRLGYLPYREAQRQPGAGALIQALGMVPSSMLHPSIERFFLDSDCLFLLCSDGLSDFERVETLWQEELVPILQGTKSLSEGSKQLVQWANKLNGYDNVTVALMHCRVSKNPGNSSARSEAGTTLATKGQTPAKTPQTVLQRAGKTSSKTTKQYRFPWKAMLIGFLSVFGIGAALSWFIRNQKLPHTPIPSQITPSVSPTAAISSFPTPPTALALEVGKFYVLQKPQNTLGTQSSPAPMTLRKEADVTALDSGILPQDTVFKVLNLSRKLNVEQIKEEWVQLQICSVPTQPTANEATPSSSQPKTTPTKRPKVVVAGSNGYLQTDQLAGQTQLLAPDDPRTAQADCQITPSTGNPRQG